MSDEKVNIETFYIWKNVPINMSKDDWAIFERISKGVILFEDGTAKEYQDGVWSSVDIDEYGRIM